MRRSSTKPWSCSPPGRSCSIRRLRHVSDIGDAENISKSYVSRILRLALLAPDIVDAVLPGRTGQGVMLEQLERPLPACWEEQRRRLV
jgi:hypothetical protein